MLYKGVLTFESVDEIMKCDIQLKATEQHFAVVLVYYSVQSGLTLESVDELVSIAFHSFACHLLRVDPFVRNKPLMKYLVYLLKSIKNV